MSKIAQRLLVFFIGIPLVLGIVFVQFFHHMPLNIAVIASSVIACLELYKMFSNKTALLPSWLLISLSALFPIVAYLFMIFDFDFDYLTWIFAFSVMILMAAECFFHKTFEESITRLSASIFIIFYSGYMITFIQRIGTFSNSTFFLSLFFFTVFINDSLAWLFGVLFGKNNRNIFAASPNKSIAGFIGGIFFAILGCILAKLIWPDLLPGSFVKPVVLAFVSALAGISGDLIESVFKRSCQVKDSGNIIPGRGGFLDSVDSLLFTAPVFYILVYFLYFFEMA